MTKKQTIDLYMKKLGCSHAEAEQLWKDEQEDNFPELTADQKKVESEMRQADRKIETTKRVRERKPDTDKRLLISVLHAFLHDFLFASQNHLNCEIINPEREIEFTFKGNKYRLTLSKPRKER